MKSEQVRISKSVLSKIDFIRERESKLNGFKYTRQDFIEKFLSEKSRDYELDNNVDIVDGE